MNSLNLSISKTLLMARLKQSVIAAAGVTFGIAMFITLVSFMTGLNKMLDSLILNRTPHIRLFNAINPNADQPVNRTAEFSKSLNIVQSIKPSDSRTEIYNSSAIIQSLKNDSRVIAVAPKVASQVFYNIGVIDLNGLVNGIDVSQELKYFSFADYIIKGDAYDLNRISNSVILGKGVADKMMARVGDVIHVTSAKGDQMSLKVVGVFQLGLATIDDVQSYASLETTQKLLGKPKSYFTDIQVKLNNINDAPKIAKEYSNRYRTDAEDVQTANAQFESGTKVRNIITYAVSVTLLIVAGFGIYNILNMMIYEKMDAIAILKATGFSSSDVKNIFINLSVIIGVIGGFMGLLIGMLLTMLIDQIPFNTAALPAITTYPINYDIKYYLIGVIFALITTYIAGYFPAKKAARIDPVVIIRGK
ncbi:MAG: ABC transporter permease [Bacteroidia bacterium]|nr:ABC transporter permease [Bacteroidota bacterium]MBK7389964.1 ABC transporter permease [Bacteroidota bacterium]MBP9081949.1 ABC transporter permease [Bacteroidia bacterium]